MMTPSRLPISEEIRALHRQGEEAVVAAFEQLVTLVRQLEARIQELEDQLAKNSRNSSKPPSGEIMADRYEQPVGDGTVVEAGVQVAEQVAPVNAAIKEHLVQTAGPVHLDETGARVAGKLHWFHVASTSMLTHLELNARRGVKAHDEIGLLPRRTGYVVHDDYASYFKYESVQHATCHLNSYAGRR